MPELLFLFLKCQFQNLFETYYTACNPNTRKYMRFLKNVRIREQMA
jgi:hypothetical protein